MTRPWNPDVDDDADLWVCPSCDAHLHVDSVGDKCPVCSEPADQDDEA